jgi:hypothetical protein
MTKTLTASLAALTILLSAGTAFAATGYATSDVNVRAKASTSSAIVGDLSAGEAVDIIKCGGGWCLTDEGYVSASRLSIGDDDEEAGDDDDDEVASFIDEDGEFDEDPLDFEDSVPQSIHGGFDDDDDD